MAHKADSQTRRPASRRNLLETLENRQLMAAFSANFNFQPASSATPYGYTADTGKAYTWQNGQTYGWNSDNSSNTKDRYTSADDRYDTFAYIGKAGGASTWEVAVPNGSYNVKVTAGDPSDTAAHYGISVEGATLISETPSTWNKWSEGSGTVWVSDGKLTVTSASGAWNNKINSIQITGTTASTPDADGSAYRIPAAPNWTAGQAKTSSQVTINWGDASTNEYGFIIERSTDGWNFTEAGRVGPNGSSFVDTGVSASKTYVYRIRAYNAAGVSTASPMVWTTTPGQVWTPPTANGPSTPSWVASVTMDKSTIGVGWADVSNETGYVVQRSVDGSNFSDVRTLAANTTWFTDTGLNSSTKYYYRIQPFNTGGKSTSVTTSATTDAGWVAPTPPTVYAPAAPTWLGAQASGSNAANLQWGDVANETGYIVERSTDGWTFGEVARVGANVTSYSATGLNASTKYVFRVKAYNSGGNSGASAVQTITTASDWVAPVVTAPAAPSWLGAQASGSNAASLSWGDVANETGFIIERSTDGWTFGEVGRVGAGVTSYSATGLAASTKYVFRVKAYNSGGSSAPSVVQTITTAAAWTGNTGGNTGGSTTITNKYALSGISVNTSGNSAAPVAGVLNDVGIKNVRIWYGVNNWNEAVQPWYVERAASFKAAGYKVLLCVIENKPTDAATAKAFYQRLGNDPTLRASVDYWQIGNEPNMWDFWNGTAEQYVQQNLKPAYEALHALGETVVGAGPSWDVTYAQKLASVGYSNYCDYAAFHPYGTSGAMVIERAAGAKAAFGKPLMVTEWNIVQVSDTATWIRELNIAAAGLSNIAYMNYYFALKSDWSFGNAGLLDANGNKNTLYYNTVKDWLN